MANQNEQPQLGVRFYVKPVENKKRSKEEGRPIFDDREMVEIRFPGDKNRVHHAPAHESYRRGRDGQNITWAMEFPKHYEAFKDNIEYFGEGTPISELPFLTESKRSELRALNIHTAESLAALDGAALARLGMGGRALKDQAAEYINAAAGSAPNLKAVAENTELREMIKSLQDQINGQSNVSEPASASPFDDWEDADLKTFIKEATGKLPAGNPKHETLVSLADNANNSLKEDAA